MGDEEVAQDPAAPLNEVEITVAGHTVIVKGSQPLPVVARHALRLFRKTAEDAKRIPIGFAVTTLDTQISPAAAEPGTGIAPDWEPEDGA